MSNHDTGLCDDPVDTSVWVSDCSSDVRAGQQYTLNFRCFSHHDRGEPLTNELQTHIYIWTNDAVISSPKGKKFSGDNHDSYLAKFNLIIPTQGNSEIISFEFIPRAGMNRFFMDIDVGGDPYRTLTIEVVAA